MSASGEGGGGCCSLSMFVLGGIFLLGLFTFDPLTMLVCGVLGGGLWACAYLWHQASLRPAVPTTESQSDEEDAGAGDVPSVATPRGRGITPWVRVSKMHRVVGEFYRQAGYEALAEQLSIPQSGERTTIDETARIGLDRGNRHARHGIAVTVWVENQHLGFLPDDVVGDYLDVLTEIDAAGLHVETDARIYLTYNLRKRKWSPSMVVRLPAPDQILPRNGLPPRHAEVIPDGPSIQVTGEKHHQDVLEPLADAVERTHYAATLRRIIEKRARSTAATIEVAINGERIGTLTPTSTAKIGPLVDRIEASGFEPHARAILTTTEKGVEAALRVTRIDEAPEAWLRRLDRRAARAEKKQQDRDAQGGGA